MNRKHYRLVIVATAGIGIAGAVLVPTLSAVAASSPGAGLLVKVTKTQIVARGAAVAETVTYKCPSGASDPSLYTSIYEKVGRQVTSGGGNANSLRCNGKTQTTTIGVAGNSRAWTKGSAFSEATIGYETGYHNVAISEQKTVTLT